MNSQTKIPCDTSNSEINHANGLDELGWHHQQIGKDRHILVANICNVQTYLRQNHAEIWFDEFLRKTLTKSEFGETVEWDDQSDLVLTEKLQDFDEGLRRISTKLVHE
ncbi:MAG: hypothetical protein VXW29_19555, partial [SAR324 cluster bacterium]|nr:hypothetical protein [SAR324 cluster bacterium]